MLDYLLSQLEAVEQCAIDSFADEGRTIDPVS